MIKIKRLAKSFTYAFRGLVKTYREEQNLHIQSMVGGFVIFLSLYLGLSTIELSMIIFLIGLVLLMEFANSAVERITDVLKPRMNTYVKEIKDIMAAAVLLASILSIVVGVLIFWPYIF
jgi:undecaprenol kinase